MNVDINEGDNVSQEDVIDILKRMSSDEKLRNRLKMVSSADSLTGVAAEYGFQLNPAVVRDFLSDSELEGVGGSVTDRTCYGTTDCCRTNRTCFGTTDCCR